MSKQKKEPMKFFAKHFWEMMKDQDRKCALSGKELTPDNTEVELKEPYKVKGRTEFDNHYLIVRPLSFMARYISEPEIIDLCIEVVKHRGKERGFGVRRIGKR